MFKKDYKREYEKINKKLKRKLSESRFNHTTGVAYTAGCLAMRYEIDIDKAMIAGLLHDCAKNMTPDELFSFAVKKEINITEFERTKPDLLHAKVGAYLANKKYHIKEDDILDAISCHTTGKPNMTLLDKILYVADYIEPGRTKMPRLDVVRKEAFIDIDSCIRMILEDTLKYLKECDVVIDDMTQKTYDFYKK